MVARIRPLLKNELDKDKIVDAATNAAGDSKTLLRIPNPKNESELFSFQFSSVYDETATQQDLFENEGKRLHIQLTRDLDIDRP